MTRRTNTIVIGAGQAGLTLSRELGRRLESEGAADGDVRDMKTMWITGFHDPDGFYVEVIWHKPGLPDSQTLPRAQWETIELG